MDISKDGMLELKAHYIVAVYVDGNWQRVRSCPALPISFIQSVGCGSIASIPVVRKISQPIVFLFLAWHPRDLELLYRNSSAGHIGKQRELVQLSPNV
jgi:hypothetical protein